MAEVERYARACVAAFGMEVHPGVELKDNDLYASVVGVIQGIAESAIIHYGHDHARVVEYVEERIKKAFPDRAYFIETEFEGKGIQVYQPFGMPRTPSTEG